MRCPAVLLALPVLALAACEGDKPDAVDPRPQPVLQGTVSDAMLHVDELRAPAPLAEPEPTGVPGEELGLGEAATDRPARRARPRNTGAAETPAPGSPPEEKAGESERPASKAPRSARPTPTPTPQASPSPRPTRSPRATPTPE